MVVHGLPGRRGRASISIANDELHEVDELEQRQEAKEKKVNKVISQSAQPRERTAYRDEGGAALIFNDEKMILSDDGDYLI